MCQLGALASLRCNNKRCWMVARLRLISHLVRSHASYQLSPHEAVLFRAEKDLSMPRFYVLLALFVLLTQVCHAEVKTSSVFGDSMVLQRDMPIHVWGWTTPNIEVRVTLAGHEGVARSDKNGRFDVTLDPLSAGGPHELVIQGDETKTFTDVLVGEVWICSGESNMAWPVSNAKGGDLELLTAKYPEIRLLSVPHVGAREPQDHFKGKWEVCTAKSVKHFSAVGYFYGRQLHQSLHVPIGLIDNAWEGSTAEAWIDRDALEDDGRYRELLDKWDALAKAQAAEDVIPRATTVEWDDRLGDWDAIRRRSRAAQNQLVGNREPSSIYNGVLHPTIGYTIRGVIWYQGESNVDRAHQYRDLFPLLISSWRQAWGQGDFPFYWVQLADFHEEVKSPGESRWAELREAQSMTLSKLPNTGQVVAIDLGAAGNIHPRNKQEVGRRLTRWALTRTYRFSNPLCPQGAVTHQSPTYVSFAVDRSVATVKIDHVNGGLRTVDDAAPTGFAIAGKDRVFVAAKARIVGRWGPIEVWSDAVEHPVAIRYGWADNPVCNVYGGLPMTPFRTDDWPGLTIDVVK